MTVSEYLKCPGAAAPISQVPFVVRDPGPIGVLT